MVSLNLSVRKVKNIFIVIGSFILFFVSMGIAKSFGIIYIELLDYFGASKSDTIWIPSIGSGLILSFGPFAGILEEKFGCRAVAVSGSMLIGIGLALSSFVNEMDLLYLTYGVVTGIGFSLCHVSANVAVNVHFEKRRAFAVGLSSAGSGIGTTVLPIVGSYLLNVYGWQGTFLILSGIGLQGFYCGLLFGDLGTSPKKSVKGKDTDIHHISSCQMNDLDPKLPQVDSLWTKSKYILSSKTFIIFNISSIFVNLGYFIPFIMLPDMVTGRGISKTNASFLITTSGISSILSRVVFGLISDLHFCNRMVINSVMLTVLGTFTCLCAVIYNVYIFFLYAFLLGIVTGIFGMYQSLIMVDIVGKEHMGLAFGYQTFLSGIAIVLGPPLAGLLYDRTGDYIISFVCCGTFFLIGGILSIISTIVHLRGKQYTL